MWLTLKGTWLIYVYLLLVAKEQISSKGTSYCTFELTAWGEKPLNFPV